jgi:hypothetical protein
MERHMLRILRQRFTTGQRTGTLRAALRRIAPVGAAAAAAVLMFAASAFAVSGTSIKLAEPVRFGNPAVAVDSAGTAYVAWPNETGLGGVGSTIEYCTLPAGASACAHHNTLHAEGGPTPVIGQVQILVDGASVVLLAEVYGVSLEYEPIQEWTSTDGGATFLPVNGLKSVANAKLNADTGALNALIVPGTNALGYAFVTAAGPPTFDEFPLTTPPQCSRKECPAAEKFATLQQEPELTLHPLGNLHGSVGSRLGANPGVLGVYETLGKPGCAGGTFDTAFVYGSGEQSPSNSYDLSPGEPNSAWKVALSPGDCEAEYAVAGGGPSGLGVVEKDLTRGYEVYHQFNQTTDSFEPSTATIAQEGGLYPSVSQDGAGGIYVTYLGNASNTIRLAYSSNGGANWTGPATLNANTDGGANGMTSSVGSGGQGWAVWKDGESVYAQQFNAADAVPPTPPPPPKPTPNSTYTISSITGNSNGTVTIVFVPAQSGQATLVLTVPTASIASVAATEARKSKKCKHGQSKIKGKCRPTTTTAGKTTAAGTAGVPLKLTVKLSSKLKALLKKGKTVHLTATLTYTSSLGGAPTVHTYALTVHGKRPHHHK